MRKLNSFAACVVVASAIVPDLFLPQPAAAYSGDELAAIVNKAKLMPYQVSVRFADPTAVHVWVYRVPRAQEKDCKIDAVLFAKTIMAADPKILIVETDFRLLQDKNYLGTIEVHASDVQKFARGGENAAELLASLRFKQSRAANQVAADYGSISNYAVKNGMRKIQRTDLYTKIGYLVDKYPVEGLWKKFMAIENSLDTVSENQLGSQMDELREEINQAQNQVTDQQQRTLGRRTDLWAQPGYAIHRRQRIVQAINDLAASGRDVYKVQAKYATAEQYARLRDTVHADVAMDNLEIELNLPHYKGD